MTDENGSDEEDDTLKEQVLIVETLSADGGVHPPPITVPVLPSVTVGAVKLELEHLCGVSTPKMCLTRLGHQEPLRDASMIGAVFRRATGSGASSSANHNAPVEAGASSSSGSGCSCSGGGGGGVAA